MFAVNLRALFILADLLRINNAMLSQQGEKGKGKMKGKKRVRSKILNYFLVTSNVDFLLNYC